MSPADAPTYEPPWQPCALYSPGTPPVPFEGGGTCYGGPRQPCATCAHYDRGRQAEFFQQAMKEWERERPVR